MFMRVNSKCAHQVRAIIATEKPTGYLPNVSHERGAGKARLLLGVGCRSDAPEILEADLRTHHLTFDATRTSENAYGFVYEIEGPIQTPRKCADLETTDLLD